MEAHKKNRNLTIVNKVKQICEQCTEAVHYITPLQLCLYLALLPRHYQMFPKI